MKITEGISTYRNSQGELKYKYVKGTSGYPHLLVIFTSDLAALDSVDFDDQEAAKNLQHTLWIYGPVTDDGTRTHYLAASHQNLVQDFLQDFKETLRFSSSNITFAGISTGATAALIYAEKLPASTVIALEPRIDLGQYLVESDPQALQTIADGDPEALNRQVKEVIKGLNTQSTDIYFLTDSQPVTDACTKAFAEHPSYNLIKRDLPAGVQPGNLPPHQLFWSLAGMLAQGIRPELGQQQISPTSDSNIVERQQQELLGVAVLEDSLITDEGRLDFNITTLVRGYEQQRYEGFNRHLVFDNDGGKTSNIYLGKNIDRSLSQRYFYETFVDYSGAKSTSVKGEGIELDTLPQGYSKLSVKFQIDEEQKLIVPLTSPTTEFQVYTQNDTAIALYASPTEASMNVQKLGTTKNSRQGFTLLEEIQVAQGETNLFNLRGWFAPLGGPTAENLHVRYYLHLENPAGSCLLPLKRVERDQTCHSLGLPASLRKSYFSTPETAGINLSTVSTGDYKISIFCITPDMIARSDYQGLLSIRSEGTTQKATLNRNYRFTN